MEWPCPYEFQNCIQFKLYLFKIISLSAFPSMSHVPSDYKDRKNTTERQAEGSTLKNILRVNRHLLLFKYS